MAIGTSVSFFNGDVASALFLLPLAEALADEIYLDYIEADTTLSKNLDSDLVRLGRWILRSGLTESKGRERKE